MITEDSKVFVLPPGASFKIIRLPNGDKTESSFLLTEDSIYELKSLESAKPKSFIFEGDPGYVRESNEVVVTSKFSLVYLLASSLWSIGRFITAEDLIDQNSWLAPVPERMVEHELPKVCETLAENGETYYKLDKKKALGFFSQKVRAVSDHLKTSALASHIKVDLYTSSEEEITPEILELEVTKIGLGVIQSYMTVPVEQELAAHNGWDFAALDAHKQKVQRQMVLQEQQMVPDSGPKTKAKPKPKAKGKKVAVGKGALDSFFKKKAA